MRRPPFSSFFALVLVLLTVSPFTAPFQTFDLSAPAGETPVDGASCSEKASTDCALPTLIDDIASALHSAAPIHAAHETIPQHTPLTRAVLRL